MFFAGLPIGLLALGWHFLATQEFERVSRQHLDGLEKSLFRLNREGSDSYFIQKELNLFYGLLSEERLTLETARAAYSRLKESRLPFINLYLLNDKGEFIPCPGENKNYKALIQKLFLALAEPEMKGQSKLIARYRPFFQTFLGDIEPSDLVYDKSNLVRVRLKGKPGFFYWNTLYLNAPPSEAGPGDSRLQPEQASPLQGGVVAFFEEKDIPQNLSIKTLIGDFNSAGDTTEGYALLELNKPEESFPKDFLKTRFEVPPETLAREAIELRKQFSRRKVGNDRLMAIFPFESGRILVGLRKNFQPGQGKAWVAISLLSAGILGFVGYWSFSIFISGAVTYFSIKKKLVALFLYGTAIPVTSFFLLGYQYSLEKRQVMIQERMTQLASLIENIDENFNSATQALEDLYKRVARLKPVFRLDTTRLKVISQKLRKKDLISRIFLVNQQGKFLFDLGVERARDLMGKFVPTLARKLFANKFGAAGGDLGVRMSDVMMESLTDSFAELVSGTGGGKSAFAKIFEMTDKLQEFWFGRGCFLIFTSFVPAVGQKHPNVLILMENARVLARKYLRNIVQGNHKRPESQTPVRLAMISRGSFSSAYPPDISKYPFTKELFDKVLTTETLHSAIEGIGGEPYLIVASPLKKLPDFLLFAMFPKARIDEIIRSVSIRIIAISLASGLFALCIGMILAKNFLWPITALSSGISAIEKLDFNYRIPPLGTDEFGDLGLTFNNVISSLEEMAVAKVVQETLFPEGILKLGQFEILGKSTSVSYLGGDYFDYFVLNDRFAVVLIGDVTGHGVPAALLMAMAKSAVKIRSAEEATNVIATLEKLNAHLFETIKRKRLMTMIYSTLDTQNSRITLGNAGHCYPYFFTAMDDRIKQIESPAFPLGARKKGRFGEVSLTLCAGDALIFYTDGLVESVRSNGLPVGYDGFSEIIMKSCHSDAGAEGRHQAIMLNYQKEIGNIPCNDDVTLIVITKEC